MKKSIFIIAIFALILLVGCERNYDRTIWINPDAECCGVKDPINNLEWLKDWYKDSYFNEELVLGAKIYGEFILLYQNKTTLEEFIIIKRKYHYPTAFYIINYCSGERLALGNYSDINDNLLEPKQKKNRMLYISEPECDICAYFFDTHILIDTIAYVYTDKFLN